MHPQSQTPIRLFIYSIVIGLFIFGFCFLLVFVFQQYGLGFFQNTLKGDNTYGIVGGIQTLNPLFVKKGSTEEALSRLLFRGLLTYDNDGNLVGDLAESWELRDSAKEIAVKLKPDLRWSDNVKITANDVLFTYQLTQQEIYTGLYEGLFDNVEIKVIDDTEILFVLPNTYIPFLDYLRTPVLPLHLFGSSDPSIVEQQIFLRNDLYSGEIQLTDVRVRKLNSEVVTQVITLQAPSQKITLKFFENTDALKTAYLLGDVDIALSMQDSFSDEFLQIEEQNEEISVVGQQYVLVLNTESVADSNDRKAILQSINNELLSGNAYLGPYAEQSRYWVKMEDSRVTFDVEAATKQINNRTFSLVTFDTQELTARAHILAEQIGEAGAVVTVYPTALALFEGEIAPERKYDMVLLPLEIGREPDMYSFWHSSQKEHPGFNYGNLVNRRVDNALEKGRVNASLDNRVALYTEFQENLLTVHATEFLGHPKVTLFSRINEAVVPKGFVWDLSDLWFHILNKS